MARLHEYQGKALLREYKIAIPEGELARSPKEAAQIAERLGRPVVVKAQVWTTGRADLGLIRFADSPQEAQASTAAILGRVVKGLEVEAVLVEERLSIDREFYAGIIVDDHAQAPAVIFSAIGGTGIEIIAREHPEAVARSPIDILTGLPDYRARDLVRRVGIHGKLQLQLGTLLARLYQVARRCEARAAEINPIAFTSEGRLIAADCRITVDDYA
ncbi:MAG TPA: succinate--CoA ligase subunit beta, partial [Chloroflexi bacterium]|nr:succinate--CoA ligase subunit beta [Chloroflexota bacterium]